MVVFDVADINAGVYLDFLTPSRGHPNRIIFVAEFRKNTE